MIYAVIGPETRSAKMAAHGSGAWVCGRKKQKLCIKLAFAPNDARLGTHVPNWSLVSEFMNLDLSFSPGTECAARRAQ
jgi:hypothetical protein